MSTDEETDEELAYAEGWLAFENGFDSPPWWAVYWGLTASWWDGWDDAWSYWEGCP